MDQVVWHRQFLARDDKYSKSPDSAANFMALAPACMLARHGVSTMTSCCARRHNVDIVLMIVRRVRVIESCAKSCRRDRIMGCGASDSVESVTV